MLIIIIPISKVLVSHVSHEDLGVSAHGVAALDGAGDVDIRLCLALTRAGARAHVVIYPGLVGRPEL